MIINSKKRKMLILQLILMLVGVLAVLVIKTDIIKLIPPCTIRSYLGIICPTCGVTRCVKSILNFDFYMAFKYHPVFLGSVCYLILIDLLYIINTWSDKNFLRFLQPSYKKLVIFYILFFFQYFYRLFIMINYNGFEYI